MVGPVQLLMSRPARSVKERASESIETLVFSMFSIFIILGSELAGRDLCLVEDGGTCIVLLTSSSSNLFPYLAPSLLFSLFSSLTPRPLRLDNPILLHFPHVHHLLL